VIARGVAPDVRERATAMCDYHGNNHNVPCRICAQLNAAGGKK
jgi:hypothetical protein